MSPERSIGSTVYPPVYGVASNGMESVKMHGGDSTPPSMVCAVSLTWRKQIN